MTRRGLALLTLSLAGASTAWADTFPSKPIRLVAPFAPGATSDALARLLAEGLRAELKQNVLVENRPGAGGAIGVGSVVNAPADGYTIVLGGIGSLVFVEGTQKLRYSALKELRPIALVGSAQSAVVVRSSLNVQSLRDLVARAKQQPALTYGSPGVGSALHLAGAMFEQQAGAKMVHVPYKGLAPALTDLQAGNVDVVFANISVLPTFMQSGKLRALAVIDDDPSALLPGVPTAPAAGMPGMLLNTWYGVMAPAGVPDDIVRKYETALATILKRDSFITAMQAQGLAIEPEPTAEKFGRVLKRDFGVWLPLIRKLDLQTQ